ncbi:MAG: T9SS C-terminal target domain-containing protein, partial [Flavobacteriia bacterium]|nr:T9SS C-terminal target domain-containing protein [Flavobacteriia bacterium]
TKNELHIQNNGLNVELIEILDINGNLLMSLTSLENISVENLDAGLYFVLVKFDKGNIVQQKLIKE